MQSVWIKDSPFGSSRMDLGEQLFDSTVPRGNPSGSNAWQNATVNSLLGGLRQAFAVSANQMTGPELTAITPEQWSLTGGVVPKITQYMDFAVGLRMDGARHCAASVTSYTVTFNDAGSVIIEGFSGALWTDGEGWTDGTLVKGIPLGKSGIISYNSANPMVLDYAVVDQVPGFWLRIKTSDRAWNRDHSHQIQGPMPAACQYRGRSAGYGAWGCPLYRGHDSDPRLDSVELSDNVLTELSKADIPMQPADFLYVGYLTQFNEIEITPYVEKQSSGCRAFFRILEWRGMDAPDDRGRHYRLRG